MKTTPVNTIKKRGKLMNTELKYLTEELLPLMEEGGKDTAAIRRVIESLESLAADIEGDILC